MDDQDEFRFSEFGNTFQSADEEDFFDTGSYLIYIILYYFFNFVYVL